MSSQKPRIGLALGSGGPRGLAHIGVIKVLEENKIPIDVIVGSSIGAVIGAFYAVGFSISQIEKIFSNVDRRQIFSLLFDPQFRYGGLIAGRKVENFLKEYFGNKKIEECLIPFAAVATDLKTGQPVVFNQGPLVLALRASIAIPLIFKPVIKDNQILVDGGLSLPVPAQLAKEMGADIVIAVNLDNYKYEEKEKLSFYSVANFSLDILRYHLALNNVKTADFVVNVNFSEDPSFYEFTNVKDKITQGQKAVLQILPQIQKLLKKND